MNVRSDLDVEVAKAVASFPPLTDDQCQQIRALLREVPAPISSPLMLGRFFRKLNEMGISREQFVEGRDQIL